MFKLQCGLCGHKLAVPPAYAGKRIKCPRCHGPVDVPLHAPGGAGSPRRKQHIAAATPTMTGRPTYQPHGAPPPAPQAEYDEFHVPPREPHRHERGGRSHGGRHGHGHGRHHQRKPSSSNHIAFVAGGVVLLAAILTTVIVLVADAKHDERMRIERAHNEEIERKKEEAARRNAEAMKQFEEKRQGMADGPPDVDSPTNGETPDE